MFAVIIKVYKFDFFRKEYPPHFQKFGNNLVRLNRSPGLGKYGWLFI